MTCYAKFPDLLFKASWDNNVELIKDCIQNGQTGYNINQENFYFETPLILASQKNNLEAVKILVENGADLNVTNINGFTALGYAEKDTETYLESKNAKHLKYSIEGMTDLKTEIKAKNRPPSKITKETVNGIDSWGFTPFMWAIWHQNEDHFRYYLEIGADVNQKCRNGTTPLMLASFYGNLYMMEELVKNGALVDEMDNSGNSPLVYCVGNDFNIEAVNFLLNKNANIDNNDNACINFSIPGVSPLIAAAIYKDSSILQHLLSKRTANVHKTDRTGNNALSYAAFFGRIDYAKSLFEHKAFPNAAGHDGKTPLSWAAIGNHLEMVKFLLENGARVNHDDFFGRTALTYAKRFKHNAIINYLVEKNQPFNATLEVSTHQW